MQISIGEMMVRPPRSNLCFLLSYKMRKGISLANPQQTCRHLLLPHVCVKLHMVFHHNLHQPTKKHNQSNTLYTTLYIAMLHLLHCTVPIKCQRNGCFVVEQDVPLFHKLLLSPQWLTLTHQTVHWSPFHHRHQGCQETWTVARRRCEDVDKMYAVLYMYSI